MLSAREKECAEEVASQYGFSLADIEPHLRKRAGESGPFKAYDCAHAICTDLINERPPYGT